MRWCWTQNAVHASKYYSYTQCYSKYPVAPCTVEVQLRFDFLLWAWGAFLRPHFSHGFQALRCDARVLRFTQSNFRRAQRNSCSGAEQMRCYSLPMRIRAGRFSLRAMRGTLELLASKRTNARLRCCIKRLTLLDYLRCACVQTSFTCAHAAPLHSK